MKCSNSSCNAELRLEQKFCSTCGSKAPAPLPIKGKKGLCPSCGKTIFETDSFCMNCGEKVNPDIFTDNTCLGRRQDGQLCNTVLPQDCKFCPCCGTQAGESSDVSNVTTNLHLDLIHAHSRRAFVEDNEAQKGDFDECSSSASSSPEVWTPPSFNQKKEMDTKHKSEDNYSIDYKEEPMEEKHKQNENVERMENKSIVHNQDKSSETNQHKSIETKQEKSIDTKQDGNIEPNKDGSIEPKQDGSIEPKQDESIEPKQDGSIEPKQDGNIEPKQDGSIEPKQDGNIEPKQDGSIEPKQDGNIEPKQDGNIEPKQDGSIEPKQDGSIEPKQDGNIEPNKDGSIEPKQDGNIEPKQDGSIELKQDGNIEPKQECSIEPKQDGSIEPMQDGSIKLDYDKSTDKTSKDENMDKGKQKESMDNIKPAESIDKTKQGEIKLKSGEEDERIHKPNQNNIIESMQDGSTCIKPIEDISIDKPKQSDSTDKPRQVKSVDKPMQDGSNEPTQDGNSEPISYESNEPIQDESNEPPKDRSNEPISDESNEPIQDESYKPIQDKSDEPISDESKEPIQDESYDSIQDKNINKTNQGKTIDKPRQDGSIDSKQDEIIELRPDKNIEPMKDKPKHDERIDKHKEDEIPIENKAINESCESDPISGHNQPERKSRNLETEPMRTNQESSPFEDKDQKSKTMGDESSNPYSNIAARGRVKRSHGFEVDLVNIKRKKGTSEREEKPKNSEEANGSSEEAIVISDDESSKKQKEQGSKRKADKEDISTKRAKEENVNFTCATKEQPKNGRNINTIEENITWKEENKVEEDDFKRVTRSQSKASKEGKNNSSDQKDKDAVDIKSINEKSRIIGKSKPINSFSQIKLDFDVSFHVVMHSSVFGENCKVFVRFGLDRLGGWTSSKHELFQERKLMDKSIVVGGTVAIPREYMNRTISYRYYIVYADRPEIMEYIFNSKSNIRQLFIQHEHIKELDEHYHQYDGVIRGPIKSNRGIGEYIWYLSGMEEKQYKKELAKDALVSASTFIPQWQTIRQRSGFTGDTMIDKINSVKNCLRHAYCVLTKALPETEFHQLFGQALYLSLEPLWVEFSTKIENDRQERLKILTNAMTVVYLFDKCNLTIHLDEGRALCQALLPELSNDDLEDTKVLKIAMPKTFSMLPRCLQSYVNTCVKVGNEHWIYCMPLLHFLYGQTYPKEKPPNDVKHDAVKPIWWGIADKDNYWLNLDTLKASHISE